MLTVDVFSMNDKQNMMYYGWYTCVCWEYGLVEY